MCKSESELLSLLPAVDFDGISSSSSLLWSSSSFSVLLPVAGVTPLLTSSSSYSVMKP
jgi:hypothetical protein